MNVQYLTKLYNILIKKQKCVKKKKTKTLSYQEKKFCFKGMNFFFKKTSR